MLQYLYKLKNKPPRGKLRGIKPDRFRVAVKVIRAIRVICEICGLKIKKPGINLMDSDEFKSFRQKLNKTQKQMSQLLGTSLKAIHSYEQGWRAIPPSVERQMFFLVSRLSSNPNAKKPCWRIKKCAAEQKKQCPAWEFKSGNLCWFINGTICEGSTHKNWEDKMKVCRSCEVFNNIF